MITVEEIQKKVEALALPLLAEAGVELVELSVGGFGDDIIIRFAADKSGGGITIAQCSFLNHAIVAAIDTDGFLGEQGYSLEFSSPGLDRPMITAKDFSRRLNCEIHVWLKEPVDGKKEYKGVLLVVLDGALTVKIKKNKEIILPLEQIIKGLLVI